MRAWSRRAGSRARRRARRPGRARCRRTCPSGSSRSGRARSSARSLVPLNAWWKAEELEFGLVDSGAKVLIADARRSAIDRATGSPAIRDARARLRDRRSTRPTAPRVRSPSSIAGAGRSGRCRRRRRRGRPPRDPLHVGHDRAAEGRDAHAPPGDREPAEHHRARRRGRRCAARRRPKPKPGCRPRTLLVVPLFHVTGCLSTMTLELRDRRQARADAARAFDPDLAMADHRARAGHVDRRRADDHVAHPRVAEPRASTTCRR